MFLSSSSTSPQNSGNTKKRKQIASTDSSQINSPDLFTSPGQGKESKRRKLTHDDATTIAASSSKKSSSSAPEKKSSQRPAPTCLTNISVSTPSLQLHHQNLSCLSQLPTVTRNLISLDLSYNCFEKVLDVSSTDEHKMQDESPSDNTPQHQQPTLLEKLRELRELTLSVNRLQKFPQFSKTAHFANLKTLRLNSNLIHDILTSESFRHLPSLRVLDLKLNFVKEMHVDFREWCPELEWLSVAHNHMVSVKGCTLPDSMRFLSLFGNALLKQDVDEMLYSIRNGQYMRELWVGANERRGEVTGVEFYHWNTYQKEYREKFVNLQVLDGRVVMPVYRGMEDLHGATEKAQ